MFWGDFTYHPNLGQNIAGKHALNDADHLLAVDGVTPHYWGLSFAEETKIVKPLKVQSTPKVNEPWFERLAIPCGRCLALLGSI